MSPPCHQSPGRGQPLGLLVEQTAKRCISWLDLHCPRSPPLLSFVGKAQWLLLGHEASPSKWVLLSKIKVTTVAYLLFHREGHSRQVLQGFRRDIYACSRFLRGQCGFLVSRAL